MSRGALLLKLDGFAALHHRADYGGLVDIGLHEDKRVFIQFVPLRSVGFT